MAPPGNPSWRPEGEVEIVAGTPAGGGQDRPARSLIKVLQRTGLSEVSFRVTNIPGRGGGNAWHHLVQHAGNPQILAVSSPTLLTNQLLGVDSLDFHALTPLANLYTEYIAFVVRADSPIADGADLAAALGQDSGSVATALATARGNINHIALARVARHARGRVRDLDLKVFDSARYAVAEVLEGRAALGAITAVSAAPELSAGTLRAVAVSAPYRLPAPLQEVPTWRELGVPCVLGTWRGMVGAPGLPDAAVAFWDRAFGAAARSPEWDAELSAQCWSNTFLDSGACAVFLQEEREAMRAALSDIGMLDSSRPSAIDPRESL
jgi:putative tricarboxylic transport membrane protein